jgi:O-antigen ligase/polysaccharide polymerase Wzy-like membrane protein
MNSGRSPSRASASKRCSEATDIVLLLLYPLAIAGYPLVSAFPVLLDVPSRIFSIPFRALMLLLSLFVLLRLVTGAARVYRGLFWVLFVLFWIFYSLRFASDTVIAPIPLAFPASEYFLFVYGMCLVPTLAFMAQPSVTQLITSAKATLVLSCIACVGAVTAIWFGITSGATQALEAARLQSETLDPISLGHLGASIVLLAVYLALNEKRVAARGILTLVIIGGLVCVALASSRGPVLSLACAMLLMFGIRFFRRPSLQQVVALVGIVVLVFLIFYWVEEELGFRIVSGLSSLETPSYDPSSALRIEAMRDAWHQFLDNPFLGSALEERNSHYYPHNIIIEAFMAGGIVLGVIFTLLLTWSAVSAVRLVYIDNGSGWIGALFIQYAVGAMTSGSLWGSNTLWPLIAGVVAAESALTLRQKKPSPRLTSVQTG